MCEVSRLLVASPRLRPMETSFYLYKHVSFSFCLIFNEITSFLFNRIDFLLDHKLLPVQLTWLHSVYGKMFSSGVWENVFPYPR